VILGFDFTSGYATLIYVLGGLLVIVALPPPARSPVIVLGAPTYSYSVMTVPERRLEPKRYLTRLGVEYIIENKEATVTVTEVVTGVRRKNDGREEQFDAFKAPALAPLEKAPVRGFQLPLEIFDGLAEDDYEVAFLFWVRFTSTDVGRWEVVYDPKKRSHESAHFR